MSQTALAEPRRTRPERAPVPPPSAAGRYVSEEEYWLNYYLESDVHYEWNNGRLEEKPVSNYEFEKSLIPLLLPPHRMAYW